LTEAHLELGDFTRSDLSNANLRGAFAFQTIFYKTDLRRAHLEGANLSQAILQGADLRGAHLNGAVLTGCGYDDETKWPSGFTVHKLEELGAIKDLSFGKRYYETPANR
jgi:uncharacterized protein YjbI with pentapeptide repeats